MPFPRAERHQPSLMSDSKLPSYNSDGSSLRRTWVEGQWAKGRQKPERKRSVANTLIIFLLVASVPLILAYAHYGKHLATFGDHSSMLPWLSASPATSASAAPLRAADEQQPWHGRYERPPGRSQPSHKNADAAAARAVKNAEDTLAHEDQLGKFMRLKRRTGLNPKTGLSALAKSLMHTTDSARAALGGGGGGGGGGGSSGSGVEDDKASSSHVMWGPTAARTSDLKYKYKAAEREVHELEDKVSFLERKVVEDRVHAHDLQASALVHAETEIARLQKTLTALEREAGNRRRSGSEERKRVEALEDENLRLERAVVAHRQHDDEIAKLTARVAELTRDHRKRRKALASGELSGTCMYVCVCVYIYIVCACACVFTYIILHIYIYVHIYVYTQRCTRRWRRSWLRKRHSSKH